MAPTTRNRGRPTAIRQSTPESQQTYLPTSTRANPSKRTLAAKSSSKSSSKPSSKLKSRSKSKSKRPQQTITQMPLLHQLYHPELYHPELEYEEVQQGVNVENEPLALRSPKRRKITETPSSKGDTKGDIYVNASTESSPITTAQNVYQRSGESSAVKDVRAMAPPTTTPTRPIRTEIPSSQSPLGTPLFALSRRSTKRDTSRSPLTERSVNLQIPFAITPKVFGYSGTREVADSMETEDEDKDEDEKRLPDSQIDQGAGPGKARPHLRRTNPEEFDTSHVQIKTSFQGALSNDDGVMKQGGGSSRTSPPNATTRSLEESDVVPTKSVNASSQQKHFHLYPPASSNVRKRDRTNLLDEPPLETIPSSPLPQKPDIDCLAARCLPTLAVETESQFEAGWHTYHPPQSPNNPPPPPLSFTTKENNNQPTSSQLQYIPSSQPALASSPLPLPSPPPHPHTSTHNNDEDTAHTQPLPSHHAPHPASLPQNPHVPASQATTTASPTQPQHYTPHHHHHDDDDGAHILVPSSPSPIRPPTPPPGFSSPLVGWRGNDRTTNDNEGENDEKHEWNPDQRVRASQLLLPASFLKDSWFVGPDDIEDDHVRMGMEMGEGEWIEEDE